MPNTSTQLNNIIKQITRVVGGSSDIVHTYASIPRKVDFANKQANKLKFVQVGGSNVVGEIFGASEFSSLSGFTATGMTPSIVSGGILMNPPSTGIFTNRLILDSPVIDNPMWDMQATFKVTVGGAGTGVALGTTSIAGVSTDRFEVIGGIDTANPTTGVFIRSGHGGSWTQLVGTSPVTTNTNDIIRLQFIRRNEIFDFLTYNLTTGQNSAIRFTFAPSTGRILPTMSKFSIYVFGGAQTLLDYYVTSDLDKGLPSIFIGDSKIVGYYGVSFPLNVAGQLGILGYNTSYLAGGGERTVDVLNRIQEIIDLEPQVIALAIGSNDVRNGVSSATWQANYSNIVSQLTTAGITVVHILPMKETAADMTPLYTYVNNTYSSNKIDCFTGFNTGTMLDVDGIHPNPTGMNFIVGQVISSGLISKS